MKAWDWLRAHPRAAMGGAACVLAVGSFSAGRYTMPTKVEIREVERQVEVVRWRDREVITKGPVTVVTKTRTVPGPAGPTIEVEKVVTREKVVTVHTQGKDTVTETEKVVEKLVERDAPRVAIFGTIGLPFSGAGLAPPAYGVTVTARVLGPLSVLAGGEGGTGGGSARVGVGLTF